MKDVIDFDRVRTYRLTQRDCEIAVRTAFGTVWLTRNQIETLFHVKLPTTGGLIDEVLESGAPPMTETYTVVPADVDGTLVGNLRVVHYSLDVILAAGYRLNPAEASSFRRWAEQTGDARHRGVAVPTDEYLSREVGGGTELHKTPPRAAPDPHAARSTAIVSEFRSSLDTLRAYDVNEVDSGHGRAPIWQLTYDDARAVIDAVAACFPEDTLLGGERGDGLRSIVDAINQKFAGELLYPTIELQAANLHYLVVKDHPLTDGNKRSAAALFVYFLDRNDALHRHGEPVISAMALTSLTLLVAMSDPGERTTLTALVAGLIGDLE